MTMHVIASNHDVMPPSRHPYEVGSERWDLVPAQLGPGAWLIATGPRSVRAWAPPGVALTGERDERLELWSHARMSLRGGTTSRAPRRAETLALADVLAVVPADFERWALDATRDQVRLLGLYLASAADDEYALVARATREALIEQLDGHAELGKPVRSRPVQRAAMPCSRC